jgi:hypothetical protein
MSRKSKLEGEFRDRARAAGWLVDKTHGGFYNAGWPDFYCLHPQHGARWVEIKKGSDRLTFAQWNRFKRWRDAGMEVWVLRSTDPRQLHDDEGVRYRDTLIGRGPKKTVPRRVNSWIEGENPEDKNSKG